MKLNIDSYTGNPVHFEKCFEGGDDVDIDGDGGFLIGSSDD